IKPDYANAHFLLGFTYSKLGRWQDAIEFILAGADAIAIGTFNFIDPYGPINILEGIQKYMEKNKYQIMLDFKGKINI
ncbi:MAG: Dihydroorotate dehydrogenase, partial [candidate division WS6 bacterium GW2011_GWC2_36_7]